MNAKQIAQLIATTCETLNSLGLLFTYNNPCVVSLEGCDRVSWPAKIPDSTKAPSFGTLEQYLEWVRNGEFTCLLFDYSLIRASYECVGNAVVGHNLLYWPCPVEFLVEVTCLSDLCAGIEMCIDSPRQAREVVSLKMRTPMRFDFDPERESHDHSLVHLHTQFDDTRLSVQKAMCFPSFLKKVIRTFYRDKWALHPEIETLHEQSIDHEEIRFDSPKHALQVSWN